MTTLGDLLEELKKHDPNLKVTLDGHTDIAIVSWRRVYMEASIISGSNTQIGPDVYQNTEPGFAFTDARCTEDIDGANTVGELIAILEKLIAGGHLQGYKGGWYRMSEYTELHADEYGTCPGAIVTRAAVHGDTLNINTTKPLGR